MNILPLVLAVLFILSLASVATLQNHVAASKIQSSFIGLRKAERALLRQSELSQYRDLEGVPVQTKKAALTTHKPKTPKPLSIPAVNPPCSRLNLFPLIDQGKESDPARYELAAQLIREFYSQEFSGQSKGIEYLLLDALLSSAKPSLKENPSLALETIELGDRSLQNIYYRMLKGMKKSDLFTKTGYPPLLDYFKIERADSSICLFHAHPNMLIPFFGRKVAFSLYKKLHEEVKSGIELEALLLLANDPSLAFVDAGVWALLDLKRPAHRRPAFETLLAEDKESGVAIRQTIYRS